MALLIILPTALRGFIPSFLRGLRFFALGLRMLTGQVYSFNKCHDLNVEAGSFCLDPKMIPTIKTFVIDGLVMMQGAVPPSVLKPSLHATSHYPDHAIILFGIIWW